LPAPHLPLAITQMMLVARLTDIRPVEEVAVSVAVITPRGVVTTSNSTDCILVEMAQEYVLVTLRGFPLQEEGVYRFRIALSGQAPVFVDVPVLTADVPLTAELH
jgi:hypothetical protein